MVTAQAPVTTAVELRNTPGKKHKPTVVLVHAYQVRISQLTQFMPQPETCKSEIGSQPTMCQLHTGEYIHIFIYIYFAHLYFPASGQAVVTGVVPSPPRFLPLIFIAHRVLQSHCSWICHRVLLTHALALSASQFVHIEKVPTCELTKLTYTRLEDNLIRHRGDRFNIPRAIYRYTGPSLVCGTWPDSNTRTKAERTPYHTANPNCVHKMLLRCRTSTW